MKSWIKWSYIGLLVCSAIAIFLIEGDPYSSVNEGVAGTLPDRSEKASAKEKLNVNITQERKLEHIPEGGMGSPYEVITGGGEGQASSLISSHKLAGNSSAQEEPLGASSVREELKAYQKEFGSRLWNHTEFKAALNVAYENEARDNNWAAEIESKVGDAALSMPGFQLKELYCKSSLCRFEFNVSEDKGPIFNLQKTDYFTPLATALGEDVAMNGTVDFHKWSGYLLNLNRPDAYIKIIRNQHRAITGSKSQ